MYKGVVCFFFSNRRVCRGRKLIRTNLHAVACHPAHRTSDLREDHYGGQPEEH